jgi:uncharacterized protein YkwD
LREGVCGRTARSDARDRAAHRTGAKFAARGEYLLSPRSTHRRFLAVLIGCLFLPLSALAQISEPQDFDSVDPGSHRPDTSASSPDLVQTAELITTRTNQFRARHNRPALANNKRLSRSAQDFADYLARTDTFSHTADGKQPSQRVRTQGYEFCLVAEHIAWEYNSAGFTTKELGRALMTGCRHSPEHRKNLLDPDLAEVGVGVARSKKTGRYYAVQDFARPQSKAVIFKITNEADGTIHYTVEGKSFSLDPHYTVTHQRWRAPELDFQGVRGKGDSEGDAAFEPHKGDHFAVHGPREGGYSVEKK